MVVYSALLFFWELLEFQLNNLEVGPPEQEPYNFVEAGLLVSWRDHVNYLYTFRLCMALQLLIEMVGRMVR